MKFDGELPIISHRKAARILIDELIWALNNRPQTFSYTTYQLIDEQSGQEWWIANRAFDFALGNSPSGFRGIPNLGWWNRHRAWRAFCKWKKKRRVQYSPDDTHKKLVQGVMDLHFTNHPDQGGKRADSPTRDQSSIGEIRAQANP